VQRYLQSEVPDAVPVLAPHPDLDAGDWGEAAERRPLEPSDTVGVTVARFGVAETGSLVMIAGPQTPTRYNFLPETCICVLRREAIVAHIEDVWAGLRALGEPMPRALNFVTGPSRTADVEQTLQLGAHGPRRLHVLISGSD
jgi:L-lactate utilization protein LutC